MDMIRFFLKLSSTSISIVKKLLIVIVLIISVFTIFSFFITKDRPTIHIKQIEQTSRKILHNEMYDPEISKTDAGKVYLGIHRGFICMLTGEVCTENFDEISQYKNNSLFGRITNWMSSPYSAPPSSGIAWTYDSLQNVGFIPSAYAAEGVGFSSIKGYMTLWKLFRNIAFLLLVIVVLIIGFLIMFRIKIDPQTIITLENALPRIAITMIFITFSFPIAGFLIDLMYLSIGLVVDLILGYGVGMDQMKIIAAQNDFMGAKFHDLWPNGFNILNVYAFGSAFWDLIPLEFKGILDFFVVQNMAKFVANLKLDTSTGFLKALQNVGALTVQTGELIRIPAGVTTMLFQSLIAWVLPGLILGFLIILTILLLMFRIFFILLSSYIKIILYIIFAPVILLMDAIPGRNMFTWWLRNLAGELIVFPTVVVMMLVGQAIMVIHSAQFGETFLSLGTSYYNYFGVKQDTFTLPFLYGFNPDDFNFIVALGLILIIPDIIKIVKSWFGVSELPLNLTLGTYFAGGTALLKGAVGATMGFANFKNTVVGYTPGQGLLSDEWRKKPVIGPLMNLLNRK